MLGKEAVAEETMSSQADTGNLGEEENAESAAAESPSEKTGTTDKSGEDGKTQEGSEESDGTDDEGAQSQEDKEAKEVEELIGKKQPIPFERFKQFTEKRNSERGELGNLQKLFNDPTIFRAVLQSKGITDPKILDDKMREAGFEVSEDEGAEEGNEEKLFQKFTEGLDLKKQSDWFKMMQRMSQHYAKETVKPLEGKLSEKEVGEWVKTQETEAANLAKEFGITYGQSGKDEGNVNTAVGIMANYLNQHPEDAGLGHTKILRLALSEKGFKMGKTQGKLEEKKRHSALRRSAVEGDGQHTKEGTPTSEWSVSELMEYRRKNRE
jgi:hypothetical protein